MRKVIKQKTKDKTMINHVKKRYRERFHSELSDNDILYIIAQIKKGKSRFVMAQSRNRTVHVVRMLINGADTEVAVVYNKQKSLIHTVFPVEWLTDKSFQKYLDRRSYINED